MIFSLSLKIAFISKPEKTRVFPGFFSQLPETLVLKFCPELETLVFISMSRNSWKITSCNLTTATMLFVFQPKTLTDILETSNVVFTTLFVLEMISKLLAYGLIGYIKNFYNVFDAAIVIIR